MESKLHNGIEQVACIYCSKTIQIKLHFEYRITSKILLLAPMLLFIKLIFSDKQITWEWWAANLVLAVVCYYVWRPLHLKHRRAQFYEEPRFNR